MFVSCCLSCSRLSFYVSYYKWIIIDDLHAYGFEDFACCVRLDDCNTNNNKEKDEENKKSSCFHLGFSFKKRCYILKEIGC
jgi:hypothetical protein